MRGGGLTLRLRCSMEEFLLPGVLLQWHSCTGGAGRTVPGGVPELWGTCGAVDVWAGVGFGDSGLFSSFSGFCGSMV